VLGISLSGSKTSKRRRAIMKRNYPRNLVEIQLVKNEKKLHPNTKPLALNPL